MSKVKNYAIEVRGLSKTYRINRKLTENFREVLSELPRRVATGKEKEDIKALTNVSFNVERNQVLGIIGDNGSGKSTLLKIISGITKPSAGQVKIQGKVASILEIGTGFHPDLSGRENVYLSGSIMGMAKEEIDEVFHDIVQFSGLQEFMNVQVKNYSSGMFMRLAFSVVTHLNADIILLDEVLAVGDNDFRIKSLERLRQIIEGDRTVLLVSHDLFSVMNICDSCLMLDKGRVIEMGSPAQIIGDYMEHTISNIEEGKSKAAEGSKSINDSSAQWHGVMEPKKLKSSKKWEIETAPGNELIKLLSVRCAPVNEKTGKDYLSSDDDILLECTYYKENDEDIVPVFFVMYQYTYPAFACNPRYREGVASPLEFGLDAGIYSFSCVIPSHLLNHGIFTVSLYFMDENVKNVSKFENVISFKISYEEKYKVLYGDNGKYEGPVKPILQWEYSKLRKLNRAAG